jgi:RNA polymerase sigma-70 factor, ECF subfamily
MNTNSKGTALIYVGTDDATDRSFPATKGEANLVARARAGDTTAFESLVMPHKDAIRRVAFRILRNREDAEDVVQTAFLDALRHLEAFQGRSRFSTWLTRIAINAAFMRLRAARQKRETSLDEMVEGGEAPVRVHPIDTRLNPEQECSAKEVRCLFDKALDRLSPLYAEVLHLRDVRELSAKEAARILELPVGTVKARLHRARFKVTRHMQSMLVRKRQRTRVRNPRVAALMSREPLGA